MTTHVNVVRASQAMLVVKNLPASAGDWKDVGLVPGSGRSLGEGWGHGNPLQYACLGSPMDRGVWWATVHGAAKSRTRPKRLSTHARTWMLSTSKAHWGFLFLWQNNTPSYEVGGHLSCFHFWLLGIMLLWNMCTGVCGNTCFHF